MTERKKILIMEYDDFLRELIGNLLHKKGLYILNGYSINEGLKEARKHIVDSVILGTSCSKYKGIETINYLKKQFNQTHVPNFYIINHTGKTLEGIPLENQYPIETFSIEKIVHDLSA